MKQTIVFLIALFILINQHPCSAQPSDNTIQFLHSYFNNQQNQLYTIIGSNPTLAQNLMTQLSNWQGLFISDNIKYIQNNLINNPNHQSLYFKLTKQIQLLQSTIHGQYQPLYSTLGQICQKYYINRPQLLVIGEMKDQMFVLESNNWVKRQCLADVIFVGKSSSGEEVEVERYLYGRNYIQHKISDGLRAYVLKDNLKLINQRVTRNAKQQMHEAFKLNQFILPIYINLLMITTPIDQIQTANPTQIYIHSISHSTLILSNLIQQRRFSGDNRPIFILNFEFKTDKIIAKGVNYDITEQEVTGMLLKKIDVLYEQISTKIYISLEKKNQKLIFVDPQGKMQIDEVVCLNSEDVVTIVIRNETYHNRGILPAETPINPKDPRIKKIGRKQENAVQRTSYNIIPTAQPTSIVQQQPMVQTLEANKAPILQNSKIQQQNKDLFSSTVKYLLVFVLIGVVLLFIVIKFMSGKSASAKKQQFGRTLKYYRERKVFQMEQTQANNPSFQQNATLKQF